jgi:hypothetical protein
LRFSLGARAGGQTSRSTSSKPFGPTVKRKVLVLLAAALLASLPATAESQSLAISAGSTGTVVGKSAAQLDPTYVRPTQATMLNNYVFDAWGPYTISGAAISAGINQASDAPPEWSQGIDGYGRRFGSNFGIAVAGTSTRYALAEAFKEDTLYYRCECSGAFPRLRHAMLSTLTGRRGEDGHRVFSIPALLSPYAGTMTAVYGWYPNRFGAKDAFRMGNYGMLAYMGENISLEFLYSGPHSLLSRMHLSNAHGSPDPGPNH